MSESRGLIKSQWMTLLPDQQATQRLGQQLGLRLQPGSILLLNGDLGSGKTTLVQSLGQSLGITEPIVSPTFTLVCEYPEAQIPLYHLDLYRLQPSEVDELHLEDYWTGEEYPLGIVAIEWATRLQRLPDEYLQIHLTTLPQGRQADCLAVGTSHQQVLQQLVVGLSEGLS